MRRDLFGRRLSEALLGSSYAWSGLIDLPLAAVLVSSGAVGGIGGAFAGGQLVRRRGLLNLIFAAMIFVVAIYIAFKSASVF